MPQLATLLKRHAERRGRPLFVWCTLTAMLSFLPTAGLARTGAAATQTSDKETAEITLLEQVWDTAHEQGDAAALERLWADELTVAVPRMPPMSKTESLTFVRSGKMMFQRYQSSPSRVRIYGDTAVVTGRLIRERTIAGKQQEDHWQYTKVYVKRDGTWRVVSFHASEVAQQP